MKVFILRTWDCDGTTIGVFSSPDKAHDAARQLEDRSERFMPLEWVENEDGHEYGHEIGCDEGEGERWCVTTMEVDKIEEE